MDNITIRWDNGSMVISLPDFFPTSDAKFKRLLKVIDLDWEHKDEILRELSDFMQSQISVCEARRTEYAKKSLDYHQKVVDTSEIVRSRKHPNGVRIKKEELAELKKRLRDYKEYDKHYTTYFNYYSKKKIRFEKTLNFKKREST